MTKRLLCAALAAVLLVGLAAPVWAQELQGIKLPLRTGARGEPVRRLQTLLRSLGYDPGPIDGIFGRQTELALRRYQRDRGVTVDGILGPETLAALERDWRQPPQVQDIPGGRMHVVRPGETLHSIAVRYELTWADLMEFNHLRDPNRVFVGQALFIPGPDWTPPAAPPEPPTAVAAPAPPAVKPPVGAVALSFNDSPHPVYTLPILDLLAEYRVRATFFVIGSLAEANPDLVRLIAERGHEVANHSYYHQSMRGMAVDAAAAEIKRTSQLVQTLTGRPTTLFRPPGGGFDDALRLAAARAGHRMVLWTNIGAQTPAMAGTDTLVARLLEQSGDGSVVMLHDGCEDTLAVLAQVLPQWLGRGLAVVPVGHAVEAALVVSVGH